LNELESKLREGRTAETGPLLGTLT
jgi:hypothetical protein